MSRRVSWAAHLAARPVERLHSDGPLPPAHGAAVAAADADGRPGARSRRDMTDGSAREVSSSRAYLGVISPHLGRCPVWSPPSGRARSGRVRSRRARPCGRTRQCAPREFAESPEGIRRATLSAAPHPPDIGRYKISRVPPQLEGALVYPMRTYRVAGEEWRTAEPAGLAIQVRQSSAIGSAISANISVRVSDGARLQSTRSRRISRCRCLKARFSSCASARKTTAATCRG